MFMRKKNIKGNEYWYLVKNEWKDGKSRQKVIQYLGKYGSLDMDKVMRIIELDKNSRKAKAAS